MAPTQLLSRLAPLAEIEARLEAIARPVAPREVSVVQAAGSVLARDAASAAPIPPRALALRDGWALAPDAVTVTHGLAEALLPASPGDHVLASGLDADPQRPLRLAGERLRASDV